MNLEFEVVEEYILHGERRFRLRIKGTRIIVNVGADSLDEALKKARSIVERVRVERVLKNL